MINVSHSILLIAVMVLITWMLRGGPFLIWGGKRKVPDIILWFGDMLPYAAMMMLVVYALKDTSVGEMYGVNGWMPAAVATIVTAGSYAWKRNSLLSILLGTILFMVLIRV